MEVSFTFLLWRVLGIKPRTSHLLGQCAPLEAHLQPWVNYSGIYSQPFYLSSSKEIHQGPLLAALGPRSVWLWLPAPWSGVITGDQPGDSQGLSNCIFQIAAESALTQDDFDTLPYEK